MSTPTDEYIDHVLMDTIKDDVLFVHAQGLAMEHLLLKHLVLYSDPALLTFVLNTTQRDDEYFLEQLLASDVKCAPKVITGDITTAEREEVYLSGGVQFVTSRVLIVDLLTNRVPVDRVAGIIVFRAHRLLSSYQENFILRLYRQQKKAGFVKAFTDVSSVVSKGAFTQLQTLINRLFIRRVCFIPRFEIDIKKCLDSSTINVVEMNIKQSSYVSTVQNRLCDVIRVCLKELRTCAPFVDQTDEPEWMNQVAPMQTTPLELELQSMVEKLSDKSQRLLNELYQLRQLLRLTEVMDIVTCYNQLNALRSDKDELEQNTGWIFTTAANELFEACCKAVGLQKQANNDDKDQNTVICAKWEALKLAINEIREEILKLHEEMAFDVDQAAVLVLCGTDECCRQIKDLLTVGDERIAWQLRRSLNDHTKDIQPEPPLKELWQTNRVHLYNLPADINDDNQSTNILDTVKQEQRRALVEQRKRKKKKRPAPSGKQLKLTDFDRAFANPDQEDPQEDSRDPVPSTSTIPNKDAHLIIRPLGERYQLLRYLQTHKPLFVIMYNVDMPTMRYLEWHKASNPERPLRLYLLMCRDSPEEHRYLAALRHEQHCFEMLIQAKSSVSVAREYDVARQLPATTSLRQSTRNARNNRNNAEEPIPPSCQVIVDIREFQSELPLVLYNRGIDIVPVTLEVGDYVLTPDVCVERKALADLTQSLLNGRLYTQAQMMCEHYTRPVLLIETSASEQNARKKTSTALVFQGDLSRRSREPRSLLALITRQFPTMRIIWTHNAQASAELFEEIKFDRPQPTVDQARSIRSDEANTDKSDKIQPTLQRMLIKLPNIKDNNALNMAKSAGNLLELIKNCDQHCVPQAAAELLNKDFRILQ